MEQLTAVIPIGAYVPILVLTADATIQTKRRALAAGATDFLTKPSTTWKFHCA
jgi:CheY-like chemotaxis protein